MDLGNEMKLIRASLFSLCIAVVALKCGDYILASVFPEFRLSALERGVERGISLREGAPNSYFEYIPSESYLETTDSLERKKYIASFDEDGFLRTQNGFDFESERVVTIIFFGGSTTEQLFVPPKNRWQSILERNLNGQDQIPKYRILNAGVSGNNSLHSTLQLIAKGIPIRPDFVVLMHNINDYALLRLTGSYWEAPHRRQLVQEATYSQMLRAMARDLKDALFPTTWELIKISLRSVFESDDFKAYRMTPPRGQAEIEQSFEASLRTFVDLSRDWGIEPILMTQFSRIKADDPLYISSVAAEDRKAFLSGYNRFNDVIREVSSEMEVDLIDLAQTVPKSSEFIYDIVHLNEGGSIFVSEVLTDYFEGKFDE